MPVNLSVVESKFYNQFKNGKNFDQNLTDFTTNLTGSVMEKVKLVQKVRIDWYAFCSDTDEWQVDAFGGTDYSLTRATGSFSNDGFSEGDSFAFITDWSTNRFVIVQGTYIINTIDNDGKTLNVSLTSGTGFASITLTDVGMRGVTPITALNYTFGLIENSENYSPASKVSGNDQGYYASDIASSPTYTDMTPLSSYRDWRTGSAKVTSLGFTLVYYQEFIIEHEFIINPYYVDGEIDNLENNIIPELLTGTKSLKYAYEMEWRTLLSNPETSKTKRITNKDGSVGWFNENFNGYNSDYIVESIDYEDAATLGEADGLLIGDKTKVTIVVSSELGFTAGDRIGASVSMLPDQDEYTDKTDSFEDLWLYDIAHVNEGTPETPNGIIDEIEANIVDTDKLELILYIQYAALQQPKLSNTRNFIIGVHAGNDALTSANSDRVMILADVNTYDESADIPGLLTFNKIEIYPHNKEFGVDTGFTTWEGWNEDGIMIDFDFDLNLNKQAFLNSMKFALIAYKPTTEEYFIINQYNVPIAGATISNNAQQIKIDTIRGYVLASGDQFNYVKMVTGTQAAGLQNYTGQIAQKLSWQDWIPLGDADTVFFDNTKLNDNLNLKSSNYSDVNGYIITCAFISDVFGVSDLGTSGNTDYLGLSNEITVNEFDTPATPWSAVLETFRNSNGTDLNQATLVGDEALFRVTWTNSGGAVTDLANFWAIHRIEQSGQNGYDNQELSTIIDFPTGNILQPLDTFSQLKIYLDSGNVVTECIIDGNKLQDGVRYNLSARLSDGEGGGIPPTAKITEAGIIKIAEDTQTKIIE